MNDEIWQQVNELVQSALKLGPDKRGAFLDHACVGNQHLRNEVEALITHQEQAHDVMGTHAFRLPDFAPSRGKLRPGQMVDGYKIESLLGEGGMAEVYLAEDIELSRKVALKLVRAGMNNANVLHRFHQEERILANLTHPQIARLYGGGHLPEGVPYFIMEYVEGVRVDHYCNNHKLSTEARLRLFLKVCAAVDYAHQHLIVHRDLKPGNILVTANGDTKLLDFGIARLLDADAVDDREHTITMLGAMTPEYASPEQVRGETVTTATDVYSLGVLLYELLSGHRPYRLKSRRPAEVARVICEQEPTRPSAVVAQMTPGKNNDHSSQTPESISDARDTQPEKLRRRLSGDLDNIILKAVRKDPSRRYSSVGQLAEDIRRHLAGLPVVARNDTLIYRAEKFFVRHKFGVVAATLILLTMIGGTITTALQARAARTQRAKAEQRFAEVRRLANSFMFEIHDSVQDLPGSTPTRQLLVTRALEYLNSLGKESQDDPSLQRDLVAAYIRIGNVQGNPNNANLGDRTGAMQSYLRALEIAGQLINTNPADPQARRSIGVIREKMGDLQSAAGDIAAAVVSAQSSLAAFQELAAAEPANTAAQQSLAISHIKVGDVLGNPNFPNNGDRPSSMRNYQSSFQILQRLDQAEPNNPRTRRLLALAHERMGTIFETDGNIVEARSNYQQSQVIRQWLAMKAPDNTEAARDLAIAHEKMGNVLVAMGNLTLALESRREALAIFRQLAKADPGNVQAQQSLAISHMHFADLFGDPDSPNLGQRDEAVKNYRVAAEILSSLKEGNATDTKTKSTLERIQGLLKRLQS
ncbi:MAG TPA: protein kinase [Pyrinomonadaceae bacterium]|nr:protein kinase [Pyrinomonadaceae bacterium]